MGIKLRQSTNGKELIGTASGQVPVWNNATQEWDVGSASTGINGGYYRASNGANTVPTNASAGAWTRFALVTGDFVQTHAATGWVFTPGGCLLTFSPSNPAAIQRWLCRLTVSLRPLVAPVGVQFLSAGISHDGDIEAFSPVTDAFGGGMTGGPGIINELLNLSTERVLTMANGNIVTPVFAYNDAVDLEINNLSISLTPV